MSYRLNKSPVYVNNPLSETPREKTLAGRPLIFISSTNSWCLAYISVSLIRRPPKVCLKVYHIYAKNYYIPPVYKVGIEKVFRLYRVFAYTS